MVGLNGLSRIQDFFFLNFGSRNVVGHLEGVERGAWLAVVGVAECLFDVLIV